jgi:hypothetical protein
MYNILSENIENYEDFIVTDLKMTNTLGKSTTEDKIKEYQNDTNLIQLDTDDLATNTNTYADNDDDILLISKLRIGTREKGKLKLNRIV